MNAEARSFGWFNLGLARKLDNEKVNANSRQLRRKFYCEGAQRKSARTQLDSSAL